MVAGPACRTADTQRRLVRPIADYRLRALAGSILHLSRLDLVDGLTEEDLVDRLEK